MIIPNGFREIRFKQLPFDIDINQAVYIEPDYDKRINSFIENHYEYVCRQFHQDNDLFRPDNQCAFLYLPRFIEDLYRYHNPCLTDNEIEYAKRNAVDIKQFLTDESLASLTPSIVLLGKRHSTNADGTFSFLSLSFNDFGFDNLRLSFALCSYGAKSVYSGYYDVEDIDPIIRIETTGIMYSRSCQIYENDEFFADDNFDTESKRMIVEIRERIYALQNKGINTMFLHQMIDSAVPVSRLMITKDFRIFLPDYNNMEITMAALPKAVFFLFLRHIEGMRFKELIDYKEELLAIYRQLEPIGDEVKHTKSIEKVVDSTGNRINELCARIREAFVSRIDESIARNYFITGSRGVEKCIILDRNKVFWEARQPS